MTVIKTVDPGNTFASIKFEVGCPFAGKLTVKGEKLTVTDPRGTVEETDHEIIANSTTELKLGGNPATLTGASLVKLTSGLKWSFH
jgi:hypothetical protein